MKYKCIIEVFLNEFSSINVGDIVTVIQASAGDNPTISINRENEEYNWFLPCSLFNVCFEKVEETITLSDDRRSRSQILEEIEKMEKDLEVMKTREAPSERARQNAMFCQRQVINYLKWTIKLKD